MQGRMRAAGSIRCWTLVAMLVTLAVLIGLLTPGGPRAPMATLRILGGEGQTPLVLPFVEQDRS